MDGKVFEPMHKPRDGSSHHFKLKRKRTSRGIRGNLKQRKLDDHLETYLDCLVQQSKQDIDGLFDQFRVKLDSITSAYHSKCNILARADKELSIHIKDERIQRPEASNPDHVQNVALHDTMSAFTKVVESKDEKIRSLTVEWIATQTDLVCLAIEIFGKEPFWVDRGALNEDLRMSTEKAESDHAEDVAARQMVKDNLTDIEQKMKELTTETDSALEAHLKMIRIGHNKKMQSFKLAMETAGFV